MCMVSVNDECGCSVSHVSLSVVSGFQGRLLPPFIPSECCHLTGDEEIRLPCSGADATAAAG